MKNKNILLAVIGGIVACIVCAGIVFLYPKNETNLKGNDTQVEEEILLGDCGYTTTYCKNGAQLANGQCFTNSEPADYSTCQQNTGYFWNGTCYYNPNSANGPFTGCTSCNAGDYKSGYSCITCQAGYKCEGGIQSRVACDGANEYQDQTGQTTCKTCDTGSGQVPNADHTGCVTNTSATGCCYKLGGTWYFETNQESCSDLGAGYGDNAGECLARNNTPTPTATTSQCRKTGTSAYCENINCAAMTESNCKSNTSCCTWGSGGGTVTPTAVSCLSGEYYDGTACRSCSGNTNGAYPNSAAGSSGITSCYAELDGSHEVVVAYAQASSCASGYVQTGYKVNYGSTLKCTNCASQGKVPDPANHQCVVAPTATMAPTATATTKPTATPTCESYDGVSNCPSWCYTWGDGECHSNPKPTTAPAGTPVTDWHNIEGPCCETKSNGTKTTITETYGCQQAVAAGANITSGACPIPSIRQVKSVSASYTGTLYLTPDDYQGAGYKQVVYVAYDQSGNVIPGTSLSWTVNGANGTVVSSSASATGYSVTYRGIQCDKPSQTIYVRASGNSSTIQGSATSASITIHADSMRYKDWSVSNYNKKNTNNYPLLSEAYATSSCYAVSGYDASTGKYAYIHNRCCGTSTPTNVTYDFCCVADNGSDYQYLTGQSSRTCPKNYTIDESLNENTCKLVKIPACYVDSNDEYHWTVDPESSWVKVVGVTKETDCKKDEAPACYKDPNGVYKWGKFAKVENYTIITSINSEELCHEPTPEEACYRNADNTDYVWVATAPAGYTKVDGVTKPEECTPPETPACYLHGQEFVWGKYENVTGYIKLDDIRTEEACKLPPEEACYKDPDGGYVWGEYSNNKDYTLVPSVTNIEQCNNDVPTPPTGLDVSKVVYIFMAILMAFGIGFIYYSSIMKKENK